MSAALATDAVDEAVALATFVAGQARITEAVAALVRAEVTA